MNTARIGPESEDSEESGGVFGLLGGLGLVPFFRAVCPPDPNCDQ